MTWLYDFIYTLAALVGWPWLIYRRISRGPGSLRLGERLGKVPARPVAANCYWIHGVSLGEINATRTIVAELRRRQPTAVIAISSTTQTGITQARKLYPDLLVFRFPLDFSWIVRRVLERVRPSVIVLMELEVWPNLIEVATRRGIAVCIANGRATEEKTMRQFGRPVIRTLARRMFRQLAWVGVQDATYLQRFERLGVRPERIAVTGSVKYDAAEVADWIAGQTELRDALAIDHARPLWVCGSTGPGEEALILDAYERLLAEYSDLQLAIIPRKPERFDEVAQLIVGRGYACLRRSTNAPEVPRGSAAPPRPVVLGDTMGELRKFYALASVVFVGRTLVALGGSDVMEVAGLGKAMIVGPHTDNFREAVELLVEAGACEVVAGPELLAERVAELLRDRERRQTMGRAGREAIVSRRGATERTVERLMELAGADGGR